MSARKANSKPVTESQTKGYLVKAKELHEAMQDEFALERWNTAALIGVHCVISAADAVLGKAAGLRSSGDSHSDAAQLIRLHVRRGDAERQARRFLKIIQEKSVVAYDSREFSSSEAAELVKDAGRFFEWAKSFF